MKTIDLVAGIGDRVRLMLSEDVEAIVTAITIRAEGVAYELTWMAAGEIKQAWLPACAIDAGRSPQLIGFRRKPS